MPLSKDMKKMKSAMEDEYGAKKGEQVFFATVNKRKLDETKPYPKKK